MSVRHRIRVSGIVQGVGFRPFVYGLARRYGLVGFVGNDEQGVFIEAEGSREGLSLFEGAIDWEAPPLAVVEAISLDEIPVTGQPGFEIVPSRDAGAARTLISPDVATCDACLREMFDPRDRRYRYPFINCTNCGPRFTIIKDVPYDRPSTTMAGFPMCEVCAAEYHDPADRRFHAQPVCCPACGPTLLFEQAGRIARAGDALRSAVDALLTGDVVAVKGLGGYHLAADATNESAVAALRARKHRESKPFAVMVPSLEHAAKLGEIDATAERALTAWRRPIVLVPRRAGSDIAPSVAPGNRAIGLMLPYTPIHHLLVGDVGRAIVLTSGNISDEPIAYEDDDARDRLGRIADAFLSHDRAIHIRTDDSVVRIVRDVEQPVRRSRGAVPQPLVMRRSFDSQVLAVGAELKNTFCLGKERYVFMSHHIGDLENAETLRSFVDGIDHFQHLFDVRPEVVAHDVHPEYLSTKYAMTLPIERLAVQHHHAHIASCLADNDIDGPVIGIAFDGLGYGTDETLWGGEFLIADTSSFERVGHFAAVPMPGGAVAIKEPWRMAVSYLAEAGVETHGLAVARRNASSWDKVAAVARSRYAPQTSSVGRLFDAVSAILGLRDEVDYEGHAAVELEQYADAAETGAYRVVFSGDSSFTIDGPSLVGMIADDLAAGTAGPTIAARFHNAIADVIVAASERLRETTGLDAVALSGGVFQNVLLVERSVANLEARGFSVLTHRRVPPNDGGISLGQAVVAAAR